MVAHLLAIQPWWPTVIHWPRVFDPISYWWLSWHGYQLTSSWFNVSWIVFVAVYVRRHNCHHRWCPFLAWHPHPDHGHPVCRRHHPHGGGVV